MLKFGLLALLALALLAQSNRASAEPSFGPNPQSIASGDSAVLSALYASTTGLVPHVEVNEYGRIVEVVGVQRRLGRYHTRPQPTD